MKPTSDKDAFLESLHSRILKNRERCEEGELEQVFACFEVLCSILSAHEGGIRIEDLATAYPTDEWKADTVEIPTEIVRSIVEGWFEYRRAAPAKSMGEAFGIEGGGQGRSSTLKRDKTRSKSKYLCNQAEIEIRSSANEPENRISQDAAFMVVAEREGVSHHTVEAAYKKHARELREILKAEGWV